MILTVSVGQVSTGFAQKKCVTKVLPCPFFFFFDSIPLCKSFRVSKGLSLGFYVLCSAAEPVLPNICHEGVSLRFIMMNAPPTVLLRDIKKKILLLN